MLIPVYVYDIAPSRSPSWHLYWTKTRRRGGSRRHSWGRGFGWKGGSGPRTPSRDAEGVQRVRYGDDKEWGGGSPSPAN